MKKTIRLIVNKGGAGSGDFGHAGIPGHQGGSAPGKGAPAKLHGKTSSGRQRNVVDSVIEMRRREAASGGDRTASEHYKLLGRVYGKDYISDDEARKFVEDIENGKNVRMRLLELDRLGQRRVQERAVSTEFDSIDISKRLNKENFDTMDQARAHAKSQMSATKPGWKKTDETTMYREIGDRHVTISADAELDQTFAHPKPVVRYTFMSGDYRTGSHFSRSYPNLAMATIAANAFFSGKNPNDAAYDWAQGK